MNWTQTLGLRLSLLVLGIGILAGFGFYLLIKSLLGVSALPLIVKVAVLVVIFSGIITLVSLTVQLSGCEEVRDR
ncbi:TPA: hypothetical protein EYP12_07210 [Candidatus Bipolaricaulota bacterium]|nr:hypothetical protein [Candidatus Bipolaricaulota bacterium]